MLLVLSLSLKLEGSDDPQWSAEWMSTKDQGAASTTPCLLCTQPCLLLIQYQLLLFLHLWNELTC